MKTAKKGQLITYVTSVEVRRNNHYIKEERKYIVRVHHIDTYGRVYYDKYTFGIACIENAPNHLYSLSYIEDYRASTLEEKKEFDAICKEHNNKSEQS